MADRGGEWGVTGERSTKQKQRFTFGCTNREKFYDRPIKVPDNRWKRRAVKRIYALYALVYARLAASVCARSLSRRLWPDNSLSIDRAIFLLGLAIPRMRKTARLRLARKGAPRERFFRSIERSNDPWPRGCSCETAEI